MITAPATLARRTTSASVNEGLLARSADQLDGRRTLLTLTARGLDHAERVHRVRRGVFAEATADWSPRQVAIFARLLTRFTESYRELTGQPWARSAKRL